LILSERGNVFCKLGFLTDAFAVRSVADGSSAKLCLDRSVSSETNQLVDTIPHINTRLVQERFKSFGRWGPLGHCRRTVDGKTRGLRSDILDPELTKYELRAGLSRVPNLAGSRDFYLPPNVQTGSWAHLVCYSFGNGVLSQG